MNKLNDLLRPAWGSEKWILEGWNILNEEEQLFIQKRMQGLFQEGLPFKLKHNKLLYIYTFSLLAQLEVLAIQIPLKFGPYMSSEASKARMRRQLLDEIFHGMVFTKILYLLCAPYALPPIYNDQVEVLCNFIREENCPRTAVMLLNLISEGWIEEVFYSLHREQVAPGVFEVILEDEHRHVNEAELYQDIGMPDLNSVGEKLAFLEEQLLSNIFTQYRYMMSMCTLLGIKGTEDFLHAINNKHKAQLRKIHLHPSKNWDYFMRFTHDMISKLDRHLTSYTEIEMTPMRKTFMTQWNNPGDPTMMAQFDLDITCLDVFNKKFPQETLTCLLMQSLSGALEEDPSFRFFLSQQRLYCPDKAYVGLVVKLPQCDNHLVTIILEDCHKMQLSELFLQIRAITKKVIYCYKKREALEAQYPALKDNVNHMLYEMENGLYGYPLFGMPSVSLSNIDAAGFTHCLSPLRKHESLKLTLLTVQKKMIWDKNKKIFEPRDCLPISLSADHRVLDGNITVSEIIEKNFKKYFDTLTPLSLKRLRLDKESMDQTVRLIDYMCTQNSEMAHRSLYFLQSYWFDALSIEKLLSPANLKMALFAAEMSEA